MFICVWVVSISKVLYYNTSESLKSWTPLKSPRSMATASRLTVLRRRPPVPSAPEGTPGRAAWAPGCRWARPHSGAERRGGAQSRAAGRKENGRTGYSWNVGLRRGRGAASRSPDRSPFPLSTSYLGSFFFFFLMNRDSFPFSALQKIWLLKPPSSIPPI